MKTFQETKDQRRDDLRQTVLEQARSLLIREGVQEFSMRKLARAMECSPGTLYFYFKNKEEILNQLVEDAFDELYRELTTIDWANDDPTQALRAGLHAYVSFGLSHQDHYQFAFMIQRPEMEGPYKPHRAFDVLVEAVQACIDQQLFAARDVLLISKSLWVGIHGITSLLIMLPGFPWEDKEDLIRHHIDVLIRGHLT